MTFPIYISDQKFETFMDLVLVMMKRSRITCISKILRDLCFTKQKIKNKQYFCKSCLQCFSSKNVLTEHKEVCLDINDAHSVRLEE